MTVVGSPALAPGDSLPGSLARVTGGVQVYGLARPATRESGVPGSSTRCHGQRRAVRLGKSTSCSSDSLAGRYGAAVQRKGALHGCSGEAPGKHRAARCRLRDKYCCKLQ